MLKGRIITIYPQHGQKQYFVKSLVSKATQNEREMIEANNEKLRERHKIIEMIFGRILCKRERKNAVTAFPLK